MQGGQKVNDIEIYILARGKLQNNDTKAPVQPEYIPKSPDLKFIKIYR